MSYTRGKLLSKAAGATVPNISSRLDEIVDKAEVADQSFASYNGANVAIIMDAFENAWQNLYRGKDPQEMKTFLVDLFTIIATCGYSFKARKDRFTLSPAAEEVIRVSDALGISVFEKGKLKSDSLTWSRLVLSYPLIMVGVIAKVGWFWGKYDPRQGLPSCYCFPQAGSLIPESLKPTWVAFMFDYCKSNTYIMDDKSIEQMINASFSNPHPRKEDAALIQKIKQISPMPSKKDPSSFSTLGGLATPIAKMTGTAGAPISSDANAW